MTRGMLFSTAEEKDYSNCETNMSIKNQRKNKNKLASSQSSVTALLQASTNVRVRKPRRQIKQYSLDWTQLSKRCRW